jgi:agmatinase
MKKSKISQFPLVRGAVYDGINCDEEKAGLIMFGAPFDGTSTYRGGSRFAPQAIRTETLLSQETWSPYFELDLADLPVYDAGDLETGTYDPQKATAQIENLTAAVYAEGKIPFMLGGEHLVTLGAVRAAVKRYDNLHIIQLDAHTDFIDVLFGEKCSHGTVMRRVWELVGDRKIHALGIRSGAKEEYRAYGYHADVFPFSLSGHETLISKIGDSPVYLTVDLDVFDPSQIPGTGTPETGGVMFMQFMRFLMETASKLNIVGMDMVELAPRIDPTNMSTIFAAKVSREMMCAFFAK